MSWLPPDADDEGFDAWDESDARVRPNPKGNRPRTKQRPEHQQARLARVLGVDRGRYTVLIEHPADSPPADTPTSDRPVIATRASELRNEALVVGDRVDVVGDTSGAEGTLARIVRIRSRQTVLRRSADDSDEVERVIVANADQLMMVVAATEPEPRPRLVHRYLVAAYDAGIEPLLVITKADLGDPSAFLAGFVGLGLRTVISARGAVPLAELMPLVGGRDTVAVGHSGVGKSTLVNALVPGADRAIGAVNAVTGRGRHTSSSTVSLRLPGGGWIIDTPGVRSFGLGHVRTDSILPGFPDLAEVAAECPRGCTHLADSPDCELDEAVAAGRIPQERVESFRRLLAALGPGRA